MMKYARPAILVLAVALMAYTGVNAWGSFPYGGNQVVTHADAVALQGNSQIIWQSTPSWTNTDGQGMTMGEAGTYIKGCSSQTGNQLITSTQLQACRILTQLQTAFNNSFATTCSGWSMVGVAGTGLYAQAPTCANAGDYDADGYFSNFTTAGTTSCAANTTTTCKGTDSDSFSISAPNGITGETITFEYKGSVPVAVGDATNCAPVTGSIGFSFNINSTTVTPTLTLDGTWRQYSGSISSLVNGSNAITFTMTGQTTVNQASHYDSTTAVYQCLAPTYSNSYLYVDAITITGTY